MTLSTKVRKHVRLLKDWLRTSCKNSDKHFQTYDVRKTARVWISIRKVTVDIVKLYRNSI